MKDWWGVSEEGARFAQAVRASGIEPSVERAESQRAFALRGQALLVSLALACVLVWWHHVQFRTKAPASSTSLHGAKDKKENAMVIKRIVYSESMRPSDPRLLQIAEEVAAQVDFSSASDEVALSAVRLMARAQHPAFRESAAAVLASKRPRKVKLGVAKWVKRSLANWEGDPRFSNIEEMTDERNDHK